MCQMSVMSRVSNHPWSKYLEVDERGDIVLKIPFHPKATELWMVEGNFLYVKQKTLCVLSPWFILWALFVCVFIVLNGGSCSFT